MKARFGIKGDWFFVDVDGVPYWARTIGEIRNYYLNKTGNPLNTGNKTIDVLMGDSKTAEDYNAVFLTV